MTPKANDFNGLVKRLRFLVEEQEKRSKKVTFITGKLRDSKTPPAKKKTVTLSFEKLAENIEKIKYNQMTPKEKLAFKAKEKAEADRKSFFNDRKERSKRKEDKISRIASAIDKLRFNTTTLELMDGGVVRVKGELKAESKIEVKTSEGWLPVPTGKHTLADGRVIEVEGGIVLNIDLRKR